MRTAATNVGDAFHGFRLGFALSVPVTAALFVVAVVVCARLMPRRTVDMDTVPVGAAYWVAMMLAGVLGTVGGDAAARGLSDLGAAVLCFTIAAVAVAYLGRRGTLLLPAPYWFVVALVCTGGTAGGDTIAHAVGLAPGTLLTGTAFLALVIASALAPARAAVPAAR
jgi:uncharacterized membrane-anchored protein